jgi:hypothetical protein
VIGRLQGHLDDLVRNTLTGAPPRLHDPVDQTTNRAGGK